MWSTLVLLESGPNWDALFDADIIVPLGLCLIGLAVVIGYTWYRVVKAKSEAELKRLMIERGMPVGEIERIIKVSAPSEIDSQNKGILQKADGKKDIGLSAGQAKALNE